MIWQEVRDIVRNEMIDIGYMARRLLQTFFYWVMRVLYRFLCAVTPIAYIEVLIGMYQGYRTYIDYRSGMQFMESEHFALFAFLIIVGFGTLLLRAITSTFENCN